MDKMRLKRFFSSLIIIMFSIIFISACGADGKTEETNTVQNNVNQDGAKQDSANQENSKAKTAEPAIGALITDLTGLGSSDKEEKEKNLSEKAIVSLTGRNLPQIRIMKTS